MVDTRERARKQSPKGKRTKVSPAGLISSSPSAPQTTHARSTPVILSASAKIGPRYLEWTPTMTAFGFAGLINGPRALKTVGKPSCFRTGATRTMAGWYSGAKRKRNGDWAATCERAAGGRVVTGQPSDRRMSAEPDEDVAALLPCCSRGSGNTQSG